jgi:aspartyl-tRNA(Asn)/glutamyl-tRNA(Gln) amidotransferase subunit C
MCTFNKEDLKVLQKLSRISLPAEKEDGFAENILKILNFIEMLDEVDTKDTKPLTHVIKEISAPLAEDIISQKLPLEKFLQNCPEKVGSFLKVPLVIEDKEDI